MAKSQSGGGERSAIDLLTQDHKRIQKLFKDFDKVDRNDEEAVRELVETACLELQIHSMLEEEIFYPAVRAHVSDPSHEHLLNEAEVEHSSVRQLIQAIEGMSANDEKRNAHFTVLTEYVKHHVKEEEKEMFPKVKKLDMDLAQLGQQMKERKAELMAEMGLDAEIIEESESTTT